MKTIQEFASADDARGYAVESYRDMSTSVLNAYIGAFGLSSFVASLSDDKGLMLNATRAVNGKFDFNQESIIGRGNIEYLDELIATHSDEAPNLEMFKVAAINHCKEISKPYESLTDAEFIEETKSELNEIAIPTIGAESNILTLSINKDAPKLTCIKVYQKLIKGESESAWIECGKFINVLHSQLTYKCQIPATTAESRMLKAVCLFDIGASIQ